MDKQSSIQIVSDYGNFALYKHGKSGYLLMRDITNLTPKVYTIVGDIPIEYRPVADTLNTFISTNLNSVIRVAIRKSGTIQIYNYSNNTGLLNITESMAYLIGG